MSALRKHLGRLEADGDLLSIAEWVHWDEEAAAVAGEALRGSQRALRFTSTPGVVEFASGVYAGRSGIERREHRPWCRIATGIGIEGDGYVGLLDTLSEQTKRELDDVLFREPAADVCEGIDLYSLGLPTVAASGPQLVGLGLLAVEREGRTSWAPVRGTIRRRSELRLSVPRSFAKWCGDGQPASVCLGVGAPALLAALQGWTLDRTDPEVPARAAALGTRAMAGVDGRVVPASTEVRVDGSLRPADPPVGPLATWERGCETAAISLDAGAVALREDPVVPFVPLGAPLTDDVHLTGLVEAAALYRRINGYWGVAPVSWVRLPAESRLGLCLVSSEILYSGFDWQLANALFSFSEFFDTVLILDDDGEREDLARALDDMWVKAHPGNDWVFSEPNAPAASAPRYRRDGETGSRLYINATWDPWWDEEYIAPRVSFESSYPEEVREAALDRWDQLAGGSNE
ncbi:MAG: UbiD family decarboxylase [Halalkalicoccus sp.]